ncbi:hypothetical protein CHI08_19285 [Peribacillus simplex]|nr:hypothetical protein CHI08_19285 [Peribacillus simplex]
MKKETPNRGLLFLLKKEMSCMAKNIVYRMAFPKKVQNERELKMYIMIGILVFMIACAVIPKLISYKYWTCIYTAFGNENYYKAVAKLEREGIPFKTKTPMNLGSERIQNRHEATQFDVFVKKEQEHIAQRVINKN